MKKFVLPFIWLIAGITLGVALTVLYLQIPKLESDVSISREEAQVYLHDYCQMKLDPCAPRVVDLDIGQYETMKHIAEAMGEEVLGFRLYIGWMRAEGTDGMIAVIRPLQREGIELGDAYYLSKGPLLSTCPVVCDDLQPSLDICKE